MIKNLTPSAAFTLSLSLATLVLIGAAGYKYRSEARKSVHVTVEDGTEISGMLVQELRAMYSDVPPAISQFQAVAEKNLFSPDRKAWAPPPPPDAEQASEEAPPQPSGPHRIRLYGTSIGPEIKSALLFFESFSSKQKHRVVREGETVEDDGERGKGTRYVLQALEQERAVLTDARGQEIVVGLYDHQRAAPSPAVAEAKPAQPAASQPAASTAQVQPQGEPIRRMEDIPDSLEEREELARQGRLRRISTPFGPAFRPIE